MRLQSTIIGSIIQAAISAIDNKLRELTKSMVYSDKIEEEVTDNKKNDKIILK